MAASKQPARSQPSGMISEARTEWANIRSGACVALAGRRGTGKTTACLDILRSLLLRDEAGKLVVFSSTAGISGDFRNIATARQYDSRDFRSMVRRQKENCERARRRGRSLPKMTIVLDDVGLETGGESFHSDRSKYSPQWCASAGRHLAITIIVCVQQIKQVAPCFRENLDFLVLTSASAHGLTTIYESVAFNDSRQEFVRYVTELLTPEPGRHWSVVHNISSGSWAKCQASNAPFRVEYRRRSA